MLLPAVALAVFGCGGGSTTDPRMVGSGASEPAASSSAATTSPSPRGLAATVDRVVDGDTIIADGLRVRLIGIDAPESVKPDSPVECWGRESSEALHALLPPGSAVLLERDVERHDRYGRELAWVWAGDPLELVEVTLAEAGDVRALVVPPNGRHADLVAAAVAEAAAAHRGLWGGCVGSGP